MRIERLILSVTYRCQCACVHCSQGSYAVSPSKELSFEEIAEVVDAASVSRLKELNLFGGEALLRPDIFELIRHGRTRAQHVTLDTNGVGIDAATARRIKEAGVDLVYLSLFSADPDLNDDLHRRKGNFKEIERATRRFIAEGVPVFYSVCIFKHLLEGDELEKLVDLARERGVSGVRLLYPLFSGRWFGSHGVLLSPEERAVVDAQVDGSFVFVSEGMNKPDYEGCPAVSGGSVFVSPYGDVQPCNFVPVYLGNVREEPLDVILDRARRHDFFSPTYQCGRCPMMSEDFLTVLQPGVGEGSGLYALDDLPSLRSGAPCNNGCEGCDSRAPDLSADLEAVAEAFKGRKGGTGYREVWLRGGEPFLDEGVYDVIAGLAADHKVCAVSNARIFAYEAAARRAAEAGLEEVHVPVWGGSRADYDRHVCVDGAFKHLARGIRNLLAAGVEVTAYVDSAAGRDSEPRRLLKKLGVGRVLGARLGEGTFFCDRTRRLHPPLKERQSEGPLVTLKRRAAPRKEAAERALVVNPPLDGLELALQGWTRDYVTNFPLACFKLASRHRKAGRAVELLDCLNTGNQDTLARAGFTPELVVREARCAGPGGEEMVRPVYRAGLTRDEIRAALEAQRGTNLSVISVSSSFTWSWKTTWEVIELCKEVFPGVPVELGGIYPTLCPEHAGGCGADSIHEGADPALAAEWVDLDTWGSASDRAGARSMSLKTSYGCHMKCSYCAVRQLEGQGFDALDTDDLITQIRAYAGAGLRTLHFWDSDIFCDRAHAERILHALSELPERLTLSAPAGISLYRFDDELARMMKVSGFKDVVIAVESTRDDKLDEFGRRHLTRRFGRAAAFAREAGFGPGEIHAVLMIGYPGQTREDLIADLAAVVREGVMASINVYSPIPGTADFETYAHLLGGRPIEDLDSFLFPMASEDLPASLLEDAYKLFNFRVLTRDELLRRASEHDLYGQVAKMV